ncbi:transglycosylase SLT domain-containing protein [Sinorhizobium medicae]|uniref:Lytic transglycosylase catalytic n=4 Tax=Sinorhizobium medicae TaxID=110321 RepID=A0A508WSP7_9HYPH|nr:lytic transglycosylase domain-containing protein [Sinorhizobium medicae]MBO1962222.1 lytic transglycosylase domain-containing protein [Sinorhizobium medicae]MDX0960287.1 lytic transglycosylase domain-containing protein [Sinorhizobium medicae]UFX03279.1 lytic transglycosylase domain-containing protein [Sinorhizobium medicae WSM1115]WQO46980.1 lytic transglycosylase domain-containing protein [Sinorhizobium medicae]WQO53644.1 lytic transglycosylase domain-containing protein [Sinorhizobium medi
MQSFVAEGRMIGHENTGTISIWSIRNKRLLRFAATMFSAAALIFADQYRLAEARTDAPAPPKKCLYSGVSSENPSLRLCISPDNFSRDVCTIIEHYAKANDLPAPFFARLIWRESLFQPDAISPKGAEGIAQFMPGTAKLRGLSDSFNAVAALGKSAEYLSELKSRYGNLGFAAAAYNAGEAGLERFLEKDRLPYETRDYVLAITAYSVEDWRDNPPKSLNIELDKEKSFLDGCVALADTRRLRELVVADEAVWAPWGIQLSAHYQKSVAQRLFMNAVKRLPAPINSEKAVLVRERNGSFGGRRRYAARIGRQTRAEADQLCAAIRKSGGACIVFKN